MEIIDQYDTILKICQRSDREFGVKLRGIDFIAYDRLTQMMDIELAIEKFNLDIERLLAADILNFAHDVIGIHNNINRQTKSFDNCWAPRHTK